MAEQPFIDLKGKIAIVTGASAGIGAATALLFARLGVRLVITGRNEENLKKISEECLKQPGASEPFIVLADVTVDEDVKRLVDSTIEKFGRLDVLVNNAGIAAFGSIETTSMEQYDLVMRTNTRKWRPDGLQRSYVHLTMLAVPHLIKSKGNIVNVSSLCATRAFPGVVAYCISKSSIDQFTNCIALELAPKGVRVNSVNPGIIISELHTRAGLDEVAYKQLLQHSKETHPLGRVGEASEVARAIAFLASDAASFTTGDHLTIDGGYHAASPSLV